MTCKESGWPDWLGERASIYIGRRNIAHTLMSKDYRDMSPDTLDASDWLPAGSTVRCVDVTENLCLRDGFRDVWGEYLTTY